MDEKQQMLLTISNRLPGDLFPNFAPDVVANGRPREVQPRIRRVRLKHIFMLIICAGWPQLVAGEGSSAYRAEEVSAEKQFKGPSYYFGMLSGTTKRELRVSDATLEISATPDTTLPYYGLTIRKAHLKRYDIEILSYPPGPLSREHFGAADAIPPGGVGISLGRLTSHYGGVLGLHYYAGDPLGRYRLDIYVDGLLWQRIHYVLLPSQR